MRTIARQARMANEKLARAKDKLLDLEAGGTPGRPLDVPTAALVEPKAKAFHCPRCDDTFEVEDHEAHANGHARLREAKVHCKTCGFRRSLWFRVIAPS
jgi:hypothetical protein